MGDNYKWLVVVNPMASVGKSGKDWPVIRQKLVDAGIDFDDILTEYPRHAIEIVRNAIVEKGYRKFISVGGDGTNNEVINGIFTQDVVPTNDITMATIPIGTGNDWRRTFNIPLEYDDVIEIIKTGNVFVHDIGKLTYYNDGDPKTRYFLNAAGTGLDEMVCSSTNLMKRQGKGGTIRYLISVVKCLFKYKITHVQVTMDDEMVFDDNILSLSVGNCRYNGGGMMMMPNAIPDDGLLDVTVIRKVSIFKFAANVKNIYDGSFIHKIKEVQTFRGKKIRIVSIPPHSLMVETEGENLNNSPFDFEILPKAINVIVPKKEQVLMVKKKKKRFYKKSKKK
ncbi:MAG: diacylglycerol kinase family lipid kinase [Bacteroidales bacterium]|nr:diacylglycerol kinase family lipid kinase [Bacteroidales bacterium]MBR0539435.1 diacylglycerol kinase family lipid kinase [Bacteroidales bacterium]